MHWLHPLVLKGDGVEWYPQRQLYFPLYQAFRGKDVSYLRISS